MPKYSAGEYIKAEFRDDQTGESEWMWVRVDSCDDEEEIVFGRIDSAPLFDYGGKLKLGTQVAVSYKNIREHKRVADFRQN